MSEASPSPRAGDSKAVSGAAGPRSVQRLRYQPTFIRRSFSVFHPSEASDGSAEFSSLLDISSLLMEPTAPKKPSAAPPGPPSGSVSAISSRFGASVKKEAPPLPTPPKPAKPEHLHQLPKSAQLVEEEEDSIDSLTELSPKYQQMVSKLTVEGRRKLTLEGHVGFDSLPQQLVAKAIANGFVFNLLCVGETGIGKSTLMESLFNMPLEFKPCSYELSTVELRSKTYDISESSVALKLTIVETAGFGDQLDKEQSAATIAAYIDDQYDAYLQEELKIQRKLYNYLDTRVHAAIYFISPTGIGLKAIDVVTMKELAKRVNVIPVIAKSDTTSKEELRDFKKKIREELEKNDIDVYRFPEDDPTMAPQNRALNEHVPFAVVGSTDFVKKGGKSIRARNYPWGIVEVENEEHCDFVKLREALLRINVEDLRSRTHSVHYEAFRRRRLVEMGIKDGEAGPNFADAYTQRLAEHQAQMASAEKAMKDAFVERVTAKENHLLQKEQDLKARYAEKRRALTQRKTELEAQIAAIHQNTLQIKAESEKIGTLKKTRKS